MDQLLNELAELRRSLVLQKCANLLLSSNRTMSTRRFASGIAHEINNPLGIISGFAELALLNPELPTTIRGDIQVIHSECNRAARILRNLLGFTEDGPLMKHAVDLNQILAQVLRLKSNELDLNNIEVITEVSPDLPGISVEAEQLIEVLLNILDNAQQAMTGAQEGGKLRITSCAIEDRIRISISDTGPGISSSDLTRIFNPFFTTRNADRGTGLGLTISQEIMRHHGGTLWAESTPDNGSTFHLELPLDQPLKLSPATSTPVVSEVEIALEPAPAAPTVASKRILVVNDEPGFRQMLSRTLSPGGHVVELAGDWFETWNLVQSRTYDRLILNLGLRAVGGMQLFYRIKEYDRNLAGKCIFITGYILSPELEGALKATGVPYLTKPFTLSQIRSIALESPAATTSPPI
jgi:two-component system NtrC family sensor kinase